jgi:hypothetical protein
MKLIGPFGNTPTVVIMDEPRGMTLRACLTCTSRQDSLGLQIIGFNHHKTVREYFFLQDLKTSWQIRGTQAF